MIAPKKEYPLLSGNFLAPNLNNAFSGEGAPFSIYSRRRKDEQAVFKVEN